MRSHTLRHLAALGCLALLGLGFSQARASESPPSMVETPLGRIQRVKELQYDMLRRHAGRRVRGAAANWGLRDRPSVDEAARAFAPHGAGGLLPNVQMNSTFREEVGSSQTEPSIAAFGSNVVAVWNDWPSLDSLGSLQGYAVSVDGGQTFLDRGVMRAPTSLIWTNDPIVTVNEETGEFFCAAQFESNVENDTDPSNGIGVSKGTFAGTTFTWGTAAIVRLESNTTHTIEEPWLAVDPLTGALYLTYTEFLSGVSQVLFQRSADNGATWDPPIVLSSPGAAGHVSVSRPIAGPDGELYVIWKELGSRVDGLDFFRLRKSTNGGVSFASEQTATSFYDNFGTGAPGFTRARGDAFPSISIDRSPGVNRGRLYLAWNESFNWYDDLPAAGPATAETEPNEFFAEPNLFTIGASLTGTFRDNLDYDSFAFIAEQDSSYVFWADTVTGSTYRMRVFCADSLTRLTYAGFPDELSGARNNESFTAWTCPASGTYFLDVSNARLPNATIGTYHIRTGKARRGTERGRDQRDVFVSSSFDGAAWTTPVRVNDDAPHFDNWMPEVGAARDGGVFVAWYDWRDSGSICGGGSQVYLARSPDQGATWAQPGPITSAITNWTLTNSIQIPNQGDHLGLYINETALYLAWTDGRVHRDATRYPGLDIYDPDVFAAVYSLLPESLQVTGTATAGEETVDLEWSFRVPRIVQATIYRRDALSQRLLRTVFADDLGHIAFTDSTVGRGVRYVYSLGVLADGVERIVGDVFVTVPGLALMSSPNPFRTNTAVTFDLPEASDVVLMVHDLFGRRVRMLVDEFRPAGLQASVLWNGYADDGRRARPGVYFLRLTTKLGTRSRRVSLLP